MSSNARDTTKPTAAGAFNRLLSRRQTDAAASTEIDVDERGIREATYPCKESGAFDEEAFDVHAVDVVDA